MIQIHQIIRVPTTVVPIQIMQNVTLFMLHLSSQTCSHFWVNRYICKAPSHKENNWIQFPLLLYSLAFFGGVGWGARGRWAGLLNLYQMLLAYRLLPAVSSRYTRWQITETFWVHAIITLVFLKFATNCQCISGTCTSVHNYIYICYLMMLSTAKIMTCWWRTTEWLTLWHLN
jgi:hypothetical protein